MFNPKEALSQSQGTGESFPKLNIVRRIDLKEHDGTPIFSMYDKESKTNVPVNAPIKGILIGQAMQMSSYSDNLGSKGGNYQSDYYLNNDNITLFAPSAKGYGIVAKGTKEDVEAFITKESTGLPKKKQILFVLTNIGLIAVATNLSISIDQINQLKDALKEKYIVLNPNIYNKDSKTISKRAKEYLGKFASKNPPKFAEITVGELITESDWEQWNAPATINEFFVWREWKLNKKEEAVTEETQPVTEAKVKKIYGEVKKETAVEPEHAKVEGEDDPNSPNFIPF